MARRTAAQLAQTRQALIESATRCFAEKGFHHTQIAEISAGAGVGISAFYGQFKDKEEVFLLIVQQLFADSHDAVLAVRRDLKLSSPIDLINMTEQIYRLVFERLWQHRQITLSAFRSGLAAVPALEKLYWSICDAVAEEMGRDMQRGQAAGFLQVERPRDMSDAMVGMVYQLSHRMVMYGTPTPQEAAKVCTRYTVGALLLCMPPQVLGQIMPLIAEQQNAVI